MTNTYNHKKLTWHDVENPTREEVAHLMQTYHIDPLVAQELLTPSIKPKIEVYDDCIYLILNFPLAHHSHTSGAAGSVQEVDFIIGKNYIITGHYDTVDPVHKFSRLFEVNSILDKSDMGDHAGFIFFYMLQKIYASVANELEAVDDSLKQIEAGIFEGHEREMVFALSKVSRTLLDFKQALGHHKDVLAAFELGAVRFFGKDFQEHAQTLSAEYGKIFENIRGQIDLLSELRATNNSLVNTKQNETMKVFTIMAFVTFPLSLLVSILGFSSVWNPFLSLEYNFWIVVGIVVISVVVMFALFKKKRWL